MADSYYRFFPGDYQRDTGDLTLIEHGAYRVLLDHYYTQGCLPADREKCLRIARAFAQAEQAAVDAIILRFFHVDGNVLRNKRADKEIIERKVFTDAQSERGKKGAEARWHKEKSMAKVMAQALLVPLLKQCPPSPSPYIKKKKKNISSEPEKKQATEPPDSPVLEIPLIKKDGDFAIYQADIDQWQDTYPGIDVLQTLKHIKQWNLDNPTKRKTKGGIRKHISTWLGREQDKSGSKKPAGHILRWNEDPDLINK